MSSHNSKCALITGASSGLGLEFTHLILECNYWDSLILVARREDRLNKIKEKLLNLYPEKNILVIATDLQIREERKRLSDLVEERGLEVECLINNAGFGDYNLFQNCDLEKQLEMINLNCSALLELTHIFLPNMIKSGKGYVLNVSSMASFQGLPYLSTYAATKAFVTSFSLALSAELKNCNISIQALCPGPVPTEFLHVSGFPEKISILPSISAKFVCDLALKKLLKGQSLVIPGILNNILAQLPRLLPRPLSSAIAMSVLRKKF